MSWPGDPPPITPMDPREACAEIVRKLASQSADNISIIGQVKRLAVAGAMEPEGGK